MPLAPDTHEIYLGGQRTAHPGLVMAIEAIHEERGEQHDRGTWA
jgi:hypothetical protein